MARSGEPRFIKGLAFPRAKKGSLILVGIFCFSLVTLSAWHISQRWTDLSPLSFLNHLRPPHTNSHPGSQEISSPLNYTQTQDPVTSLLHPEHHVFREPETIYLDWRVSLGVREPDAVKKDVYLVNGQFPGPTIEARSGDRLVVRVHNELETEGLSIHWHGLKMMNQNTFDGVVGITQCPIEPGSAFNYSVNIGVEEAGTFWWHGHSGLLRGDGLFGGLVIHRPHEPEDSGDNDGESWTGETEMSAYNYTQEHLLLVGDWYHRSGQELLEWYHSPRSFRREPVPESMLVNGWGHFDCVHAPPALKNECTAASERAEWSTIGASRDVNSRTRLRIVNVGSLAGISLAIPGAQMEVITIDGGARVKSPSLGEGVGILHPGERVDLVMNSSEQGSPYLLVSLDNENFKSSNPSLQRNQSFSLQDGQPDPSLSATIPWEFPTDIIDLSELTSFTPPPWHSRAPNSVQPEDSYQIVVYAKTQSFAHNENKPMGYINNTSWNPQAEPLFAMPRSKWDQDQFVPFIPRLDLSQKTASASSSATAEVEQAHRWVDITINNLDDGAHPFHLHGYSFYVLSQYRADRLGGWGSVNPFAGETSPSGQDLEHPLRKDTVSVPRRGHVVIRFLADNPGLWMLHCHMLIHQGTGMGMSIHVGDTEDHEEDGVHASQSSAYLDLCHPWISSP